MHDKTDIENIYTLVVNDGGVLHQQSFGRIKKDLEQLTNNRVDRKSPIISGNNICIACKVLELCEEVYGANRPPCSTTNKENTVDKSDVTEFVEKESVLYKRVSDLEKVVENLKASNEAMREIATVLLEFIAEDYIHPDNEYYLRRIEKALGTT